MSGSHMPNGPASGGHSSGAHSPADGAGDPSMEDILASIRRILSEEEGQGGPAPAPPPVDDVLQLDQTMMLPSGTVAPPMAHTPMAHTPIGEAPPAYAEPVHVEPVHDPVPVREPEPMAEMVHPATPLAMPAHREPPVEQVTLVPEPVREAGTGFSGLVAPEAAAAAALSVGSLVRTLSAERSMQVHSGGPTIEDIVRQEIRPLLKHWLDTNLPPMVERLVRTEIERVVGRAVP